MDNYTLSYSRQKKLEKEETILDEEVNKQWPSIVLMEQR